jgi:hypothetical protein
MGKIERAVRDLLTTAEVPAFTTSELCQHVYGEVTKSRRVSMLRIMKRIAADDPLVELTEISARGYDAAGRWASNSEVAILDATREAACNRAYSGNVDLEAPPTEGGYATFVHRRALLRAGGEDATEFEAAWRAASAERLGNLGRQIRGEPDPEEERKRLADEAARALIRLMLHEGNQVQALRVELVGEGDDARVYTQWHGGTAEEVPPFTR